MISTSSNRVASLVACIMFTAAACAPAATRPGVGVGSPVADPDSVSAASIEATAVTAPTQATFAWSLDEAGSRIEGRGVVRFEADRIRLDLFGPRGETYLIAALVGEEFRVPPSVSGFELPSRTLLWAALGSIRPPSGAALSTAVSSDDATVITYASGGETFTFTVVSDQARPRLANVTRASGGSVVEAVRIEASTSRTPARAVYTDRQNFRELSLEFEETRSVAGFPPEIWSPDGTRRE